MKFLNRYFIRFLAVFYVFLAAIMPAAQHYNAIKLFDSSVITVKTTPCHQQANITHSIEFSETKNTSPQHDNSFACFKKCFSQQISIEPFSFMFHSDNPGYTPWIAITKFFHLAHTLLKPPLGNVFK